MKRIYYNLITKISNSNEYWEIGDVEDFAVLCDLAIYYDMKENNNTKKSWKKHYNSRKEAFEHINELQIGERLSYKIVK